MLTVSSYQPHNQPHALKIPLLRLPGSKFISLPCDSMHETIWFHPIISCRFHAYNHMVPCMESYGVIWFHAWNRMESYGSMHGIVWNHMVSSMESHGII